MTLKEKISQIIECAKTHTIIQKRFNEQGYTGATSNTGLFSDKFWTIVPMFDYEKVTRFYKLCYNNSNVTEVYLKNTHNVNNFYQAFYGCTALKRIETLDLTGYAASTTNMFVNCKSLTHIRFSGVISSDLDLKYSPLDLESAKNVILHLKDYTDTEEANTKSIYFNESVWGLLDADGNTAPNGGTWSDYVVYQIKWNK